MKSITITELSKAVTSPGWEILTLISNTELSYKELRESLALPQVKAQRELYRLEGMLLIKSERSRVDERAMVYSITEYGQMVLSFKKGI